MDETLGTPVEDQDPLAMPASQIDTRFPRLVPDRIYRMIVRSPEIVSSKKDESVKMLVLKLETTKEAMDTDGRTVYPGYKFTHRITVTPSENRELSQIGKDLAMLLKAAEGPNSNTTPRQLVDNPSLLDGKLVDVKVGLQKEKDGFPESNTARFVVPA